MSTGCFPNSSVVKSFELSKRCPLHVKYWVLYFDMQDEKKRGSQDAPSSPESCFCRSCESKYKTHEEVPKAVKITLLSLKSQKVLFVNLETLISEHVDSSRCLNDAHYRSDMSNTISNISGIAF